MNLVLSKHSDYPDLLLFQPLVEVGLMNPLLRSNIRVFVADKSQITRILVLKSSLVFPFRHSTLQHDIFTKHP